MSDKYDAIIIGAGHNGLVTAAYLARAGRKVLVLERRELVGGCVVTEELWPGFKVSTASYVNSLFRPEIIRDLELKRHGFAMLPAQSVEFHALARWPLSADGARQGNDPSRGFKVLEEGRREAAEVRGHARTRRRFPRTDAGRDAAQSVVDGAGQPDAARSRLAWNFRKLGTDGQKAIEILTGAANPILDRWFESEEVKTTISTDAIIGAFATPSMPGTAYVLFHHVMGECDGVRGVWGYVRGGMGALSNAIASAARRRARKSRSTRPSRAFWSGMAAPPASRSPTAPSTTPAKVVSCLDANVTFLRLMDPKDLPADFVESVKHLDYSSASCKINLALSEVPNFTCLPGNTPGPQHHGTIHIEPQSRLYREGVRLRQVRLHLRKSGHRSHHPVPSTIRSRPRANT